MYSIRLQIYSRMVWKRKCILLFKKKRGGIADVMINKYLLKNILVITSAFNWIASILKHEMEKEMY